MYLEKSKSKRNGEDGYYLRVRMWVKDHGKNVRKTVMNIGFVSKNNPEELKKWKTIVKYSQELYLKANKLKKEYSDSSRDGSQKSLNLGCCFILQILAIYSVREILAGYQRSHDFDYQLYQDLSYLVIASIIDPSSIENAVNTQNEYYVFYNISEWDAYRCLDRIYENMDKILRHFSKVSIRYFADSDGFFYIDGTNSYTYSSGDEQNGFRRKGVSKEDKNLPLIGMQLIMSHNGFPITFYPHPGNRHDSSQFIPAVKEIEKVLEDIRLFFCGDSAYNSGTNNFYLAGKNIINLNNNAYLFARPVKTISEQDAEWILDQNGWYDEEGKLIDPKKEGFYDIPFRYKERNISRIDEIWNYDKTKKIPVEVNLKQVAYFSEPFRTSGAKRISKNVKKALAIRDNPSGSIRKNLKNMTDGYTKLEGTDTEVSLNVEKITKDLGVAGYLLLETSERDVSPLTLLHIYNDKFWVEWLFRILKSELSLRPYYLRLEEHIKAFMLIRFIALVVVRALQHFLGYKYSTKEIVKSLTEFRCIKHNGKFIVYGRNEIIQELEDFFDLHFTEEMTKSELNKVFSYKNMARFRDKPICKFVIGPPGLKLTVEEKLELSRKSKIYFY